jgi:hypothetical protein
MDPSDAPAEPQGPIGPPDASAGSEPTGGDIAGSDEAVMATDDGDASDDGDDRDLLVTPPVPAPPTAPPPPALPPAIPPDKSPTRYADARAGQRTVMQQHIGETTTRRITDVLRVTDADVVVRQTVESGEHTWQSEMTFNRYVSDPQFEPPLAGEVIGRETLVIDGRELNCEVREGRDGGLRFRTYLCPEVFGWVVRHEQHDAGQWVRRLELVEFRD